MLQQRSLRLLWLAAAETLILLHVAGFMLHVAQSAQWVSFALSLGRFAEFVIVFFLFFVLLFYQLHLQLASYCCKLLLQVTIKLTVLLPDRPVGRC